MNATQWETLTDFTKWLGREGENKRWCERLLHGCIVGREKMVLYSTCQVLSCIWPFVTPWMVARQTSLSTFCVNLRKRGWVGQLETSGEECLLQGCFCALRVCKGVWSCFLDHAKIYHWSIHSLGWISVPVLFQFFPPHSFHFHKLLLRQILNFAASFPISNRIEHSGKEKGKKFFLSLYYLFSVFLYSIFWGSFLLVRSGGISCIQ